MAAQVDREVKTVAGVEIPTLEPGSLLLCALLLAGLSLVTERRRAAVRAGWRLA